MPSNFDELYRAVKREGIKEDNQIDGVSMVGMPQIMNLNGKKKIQSKNPYLRGINSINPSSLTRDWRWVFHLPSLLNWLVTQSRRWSGTTRTSVSSNWNRSWFRSEGTNSAKWNFRPSTWTNPCCCLHSLQALTSMRSNRPGTGVVPRLSPSDTASNLIHR